MRLLLTNLQLSQAISAQAVAPSHLQLTHWDWLTDLTAIRMRQSEMVWIDHPLVTVNQCWAVNQVLQRRSHLEFRLEASTFIQQVAQFSRNPENQSQIRIVRDQQGRQRETLDEAGRADLLEIEGLWSATARPGLRPADRMAVVDLALRWGKLLPWVKMPNEMLELLSARCHALSPNQFGGSEWLEYWYSVNASAEPLPKVLAADPANAATFVGLARVVAAQSQPASTTSMDTTTGQPEPRLAADLARLQEYQEVLVSQYNVLSEDRDRLERLLIDLQGSLSWRATEPFRAAMRILGNLERE